MKKKTDTTARGWVALTAAVDEFGMTAQGFHKVVRPLIPDTGVRDAGKRGKTMIHMPSAIAAYSDAKAERAKAAALRAGGDPMLLDGSSPALEEYRRHRARLAQLDVAEREAALVNADELRTALAPAILAMRGTGDRLVRRFGNECGAVFNEGVDEAEAAALRAVAAAAASKKEAGQ